MGARSRSPTAAALMIEVVTHGVEVFVFDAAVSHPDLAARLDRATAGARRD